MKRLTNVRLINWHRFENETIPFSASTLLSGENGAGKSTILDAIQFAVTCSKANFNKAAHEKGKRTLNSYIRCKTGREDRPYERTGALSAHIALEFFDEAKNAPFIIGVVMDTASEEKEPNTAWYLLERQELDDSLFFKGRQVKSISVFRHTTRGIKSWCATQSEAKRMILSRFGRIDQKFFSLVPKALAFRPIHDIKDFVYSYVLDEKEVNIDALRENVRSYQDLERMLEDVKGRISELEQISAREKEAEQIIRRNRINDYYIARAQADLTAAAIADLKTRISRNELLMESLTRKLEDRRTTIGEKESMIRALSLELDSDEDFRALTEAKRIEEALKKQLVTDEKEVAALLGHAKTAAREARKLSQLEQDLRSDSASSSLKDSGLNMKQDPAALLRHYAELLESLKGIKETADVLLPVRQVLEYKQSRYRAVTRKAAESDVRIRQKKEELRDVDERIRMLEGKQLVYRPEVLELKSRIETELRSAGKKPDVRILCELLEVTDPKWQNAVEGYLNTQRFYLITEPDAFDLALSVYDRMRAKRRVYGVGLINTQRLEDYDKAPEGSLAAFVTSQNVWARRYINMVLGKVHCCRSYQELKNYPTSITQQCMRYQNHVVSAINPAVFGTPYIGAGAYKVQLAKAKEERAGLDSALKDLTAEKKKWEAFEKPLATEEDREVRSAMHYLDEQRAHKDAYARCGAELKRLSASRTMIEKQIRIDELTREKAQVQQETDTLNRKIGGAENAIAQSRAEIETREAEHAAEKDALTALRSEFGEDTDRIDADYAKQTERRDLRDFLANRQRAGKANETLRDKAVEDMRKLMRAYQSAHNFGAPDTMEGYPEYAAEYNQLKNSKLLEYEDKVYRARNAAEEEFREQFLSRLQENIKEAREEFKELNAALKDIHFSHERYVFLSEPKKSLRKYYDMIMDDFNVMEGTSIFSGIFNANHREVIEELFEKLALDDENSAKTLQEYTDYRTYMDYDIRIELDDGSYMLYSKVSREKSGGETQTPFYITVAASFMQLYKGSIGGDAVGLIMMDEAFNNMDDERIAGVLSFMKGSNLQTIIAAPPDKIQYIGPAMDRVLLVLADQDISYVEDFTHEGIVQEQ